DVRAAHGPTARSARGPSWHGHAGTVAASRVRLESDGPGTPPSVTVRRLLARDVSTRGGVTGTFVASATVSTGGRLRARGRFGDAGSAPVRVRLDGVSVVPLAEPYLRGIRLAAGTLTGTTDIVTDPIALANASVHL